MRDLLDSLRLQAIVNWMLARARESSTWAGLAMIAVAMGSDPMQAHALAQAISLVIGGGLIAATPAVPDEGGR